MVLVHVQPNTALNIWMLLYTGMDSYDLHFEKGHNIGGLIKKKCNYEHTGTIQKWRPDIDVFTDIDIPLSYYQEMLKKQAVVNSGVKFILYDEESEETFEYLYKDGIIDYINEINQGKGFTDIQFYETTALGKDREDKPEYKVKMQVAFCFNNDINMIEYYHISSFLEYGGSPDKAVKSASVYEIDKAIGKKVIIKTNQKLRFLTYRIV